MLIRTVTLCSAVVLLLGLLAPSVFPQSVAPSRAVSAVVSGGWSSPSTWSCVCTPVWTDIVTVPAGQVVTVDTPAAIAQKVIVEGTLSASRTVSSVLTVAGNLIVQGSGVLDYGTPASRIPASVVARIRFWLNEANYVGGSTMVPLDSDVGLWVVENGKIFTAGPLRDGWAPLTQTAGAGAIQIMVESAFSNGWRIGDQVVIGPSHVGGESAAPTDEVRTITAILAPGVFALNTPLLKSHVVRKVDWTDAWGDAWSERLAPPVANLSRNIVFDAVNSLHRPHLMVLDAAVARLEDVAVFNFSPKPKNLGKFPNGRDKPMSRYGIHFHMQKQASVSSTIKRAVVAGGVGDGIHIHDSYGVVMEDVVVYDQAKAPFVPTYPIYLEGHVVPASGFLMTDSGANQAWIDRPLTMRFGSPQSIRTAGIWAEAGVAAYIVGAHCAGAQGKLASCMHWHNTFSGDENGQSSWPVVSERQPRLLRGTAHSMATGFSTWQNPGPAQDIADLVMWNNTRGLDIGAYISTRRFFGLRAIGNSQTQFRHTTSSVNVMGFLADGLNATGSGIMLGELTLMPTGDAVYEMGVVRGVAVGVTFQSCLQNVLSPCGSKRSWTQFSRVSFDGDPLVKFIWHPSNETRLRFRNQTNLLRPANFTLYRKDQTAVGGSFDAEYEAVSVNGDTTGAFPKPPSVRMLSGGSFAGCVGDEAVAAGVVTLCAESDAPVVEFWAAGKKIATVTPAGGTLATASFDLSTWPYGRAYVFAKAIAADGRYNISRVIRIQKTTAVTGSSVGP